MFLSFIVIFFRGAADAAASSSFFDRTSPSSAKTRIMVFLRFSVRFALRCQCRISRFLLFHSVLISRLCITRYIAYFHFPSIDAFESDLPSPPRRHFRFHTCDGHMHWFSEVDAVCVRSSAILRVRDISRFHFSSSDCIGARKTGVLQRSVWCWCLHADQYFPRPPIISDVYISLLLQAVRRAFFSSLSVFFFCALQVWFAQTVPIFLRRICAEGVARIYSLSRLRKHSQRPLPSGCRIDAMRFLPYLRCRQRSRFCVWCRAYGGAFIRACAS